MPEHILHLVHIYGYPVVFLVMVFEGPIMTVTAAFVSSLGFLSPPVVAGMAILGNIIPDIVFYLMSKRIRVLDRTPAPLREHLSRYPTRILLVSKILPSVPTIVFPVAASVLGQKRFFFRVFPISVFYAGIFFTLGFFAGKKYGEIVSVFKAGEVIAVVLSVAFFLSIAWLFVGRRIRRELFPEQDS